MKKYQKYIWWFVVLLPLMLFRDFTPDNELRYLNIADEALRDGHLFCFFNQGEAYADKPPLYLWIVMLSRLLWGGHSLLWLGLFSVLPAFVILAVMDEWIKDELESKYRHTGQLMLLTTVYFLGGMAVLRMDMLMAMFIVLALRTFYRMYEGKEGKRDVWLLPLYVFLALFTKGPFGVMIPVAAILVFLVWKRQWRTAGRYLGGRFWALLGGLSLLWFACVYIEGGNAYLHNLLFNQTVNRAVDSFSHKKGPFFYLWTCGYALAPWCLLYAGMLVAGIWKKLITTDLERFFLTVFATSFVMLSLISAKLEIYLLPAYPFIAYYSVLILQKVGNNKWVALSVAIPAGILALSFTAFLVLKPIIPEMGMIKGWPPYVATFLLMLFAGEALHWLRPPTYTRRAIHSIAIGMLCTVFTGSFLVRSINPVLGYGELAKKGIELADKYDIHTYVSYKVSRASGMEVYLKQDLELFDDVEILLPTLKVEERAIVFLRNRAIEREEALREAIADKEKYEIGKHTVVVWQ